MSKNTGLFSRGFRQGSFIDCQGIDEYPELKDALQNGRAIENKRNSPIEAMHRVIVLSQDCDIHSADDRFIELATAKPARSIDASTQRARNLRKLHLPMDGGFWEIESSLISIIPKRILDNATNIQPAGCMNEYAKEILIQWRVNRYARQPFPDKFNRAFFSYLHCESSGLSSFFEDNRGKILDVFAFVDPSDDENADEYQVSMTVVLRTGATDNDVAELEGTFRAHIQELDDLNNGLNMLQIHGNTDRDDLPNADLVCLPADFSFEDANSMRRLTLDFLCWDEVSPDAD